MNNYTITVKALGYTTIEMTLSARSIAEARHQEHEALRMWLRANDVDEDSLGLAFVETRKRKEP
jgi:hypothetical protein